MQKLPKYHTPPSHAKENPSLQKWSPPSMYRQCCLRATIYQPDSDEDKDYYATLVKEGKIPAKSNMADFIEELREGHHIPNSEDAELITRFEMQNCCPDILITNYSMLEYMLFRPRESSIWDSTKKWLQEDPNNKLLFIIDEAHMYRGSAGGEVSLLIRRLFHRLGIERNRVQFILTTASMPDATEDDKEAVRDFAKALTAADTYSFTYLTGDREVIDMRNGIAIPFTRYTTVTPEQIESNDSSQLTALNIFWKDIAGAPTSFENNEQLYSTLPESETMENVAGYKSLRMASRTNQRIIMVNKGAGGKGFMVCPDCGAAMPGDDPSVLEKVDRPYITVPKFKCSHRDAENLNLGYDFVTDMLVLEISLDPNKVETDREDNLWVNRAGQSLSETIRLVVSRILDVEFTELMTGYRVRKNQTGAYIDVYRMTK